MIKTSSIELRKLAIGDIIILGGIYIMPTLSHLLSFPLYLIDPMRFAVMGSILFLRNQKNAFFLALTLPLFSFIVGGHPVFLKSLLISFELFINVFLFFELAKRYKISFLNVLLSIVVSKSLYYASKYALISIGLLETTFVDTSLSLQLLVAVIISLSFVVVERRRA